MKFNHPSSHNNDEEEYFSEAEEASEAEEEQEESEGKDDEKKNKKEKKPAKIKLAVRKPLPKLDATRICGERGLKNLQQLFSKFQSKGDGHEYRDLDIMISKYEYWAHRMFPMMKFSDVIEKLEKLGDKREVKSMLYRMRLGETTETSENVHMDENHDHALADEQMTARVMDMMNNIQSDRDDDEEDEDMFDRVAKRQVTTHSQVPSTAAASQEEEDEDELLKNLVTV